jgi:hypothetical protein
MRRIFAFLIFMALSVAAHAQCSTSNLSPCPAGVLSSVSTLSINVGGNAMTFPGSPSVLLFKVGSFINGDCLAASGTNGAVVDIGAPCGGGGGGGGSGTVTNLSVVSTNGFAGTVASSTTTPAITLETTVTGLLKGNGTAVSQAISGTDYLPVALTSADFIVGNGSNAATGVAMSGDASLANTGAISVNHLSHVTDGSLANTGLASAVITINGINCTLGGSCTVTGGGGGGGSGTVTNMSIVPVNGFSGTVATSATTPAVTLSTTISGILKGSSGALVQALSGTDYLPVALPSADFLVGNVSNAATGVAMSGDSTLANNGVVSVNNLSHVTNGSLATTGLAQPSTTINGTTCTLGSTCTVSGGGGSGTVTTMSVVPANGLNGTVATATTTPAITLGTSVTGLLKGNGTGVSAAVPNTDYLAVTAVDCPSILASGGNASGNVDNAPALNAMFTAGATCIFFPPGRYLFSSAISRSFPAVANYSTTFVGAGAEVSTLFFNGTNGVTFNLNKSSQSVHVRDLTFSTGQAGTFSGLIINQSQPLNAAQSDITRVTFRGDDGNGATDYWLNGISTTGLSFVNFIGDLFYGSDNSLGNGVVLSGDTSISPNFGIVFNFTSCGFFNNSVGIYIATYIQGVTVAQSNFTNGVTGIFLAPGAIGMDQLTVNGSQFNEIGNNIFFDANFDDGIIQNNLIFVEPNQFGVSIGPVDGARVAITGNIFVGVSNNGSTGILVDGPVSNGIITGNAFNNLATGSNLSGANTGWNVQSNSYQTIGTNVANHGSNTVGGGSQ